jgi:hypothetical protein
MDQSAKTNAEGHYQVISGMFEKAGLAVIRALCRASSPWILLPPQVGICRAFGALPQSPEQA